jgi:hypothetical protein
MSAQHLEHRLILLPLDARCRVVSLGHAGDDDDDDESEEEGDSSDEPYRGPHFEELDDTLQQVRQGTN